MQVECAEISLLGGRENNQDRLTTRVTDQSALLVVSDGMGGHADGERAAEIAVTHLAQTFTRLAQPPLDPYGFLHVGLGQAHERIVQLGVSMELEHRPRATGAVCLVHGNSAYLAHVGDSRIYHLRRGKIIHRTRDHSHVELLLRSGLISAEQAQNHPMRNFVESCLGGEELLPEMTLAPRRALLPGDLLLLCTDGFWASLDESLLVATLSLRDQPLNGALRALAEAAVRTAGAAGDNTSAVALRYQG
ncbi:MAG: serine/threonine-protein phosphatase [Steroidobacteraceae bacterium]